jgi:hypothetical protein
LARQPPPKRFNGQVARFDLEAGTALSRVHRSAFESTAFNPVASEVLFGGGRFDSTEKDSYSYLYAGESDRAAIAEGLLRDVEANDRGARFLAKEYWRGRQLSRLQTTVTLPLISLIDGEDLGAIGQDTWLTTCDADDYPLTRSWAHWLRGVEPDAAGLAWLSKRHPGSMVLCLFEDRCPAGALAPTSGPLPGPCVFEKDPGFAWLRDTLAGFRVAIRRR